MFANLSQASEKPHKPSLAVAQLCGIAISGSWVEDIANQNMFPGPPEYMVNARSSGLTRVFAENIYHVPSSTVVAHRGPNTGKPVSCPVFVRSVYKNDLSEDDAFGPSPFPFVLVYFHPNGQALEDCVNTVNNLNSYLNCTVVAVEYPGYGITQEHFKSTRPADIDAWADDVLLWLTKTLEIPANQIIPFGRSIGTGPAARMASVMVEKCGQAAPGVVLQSPFTSIRKLVARLPLLYRLLGRLIVDNYWDNEAALRTLDRENTRLLILHGKQDKIIPYEDGKKLYNQFWDNLKDGYFPENRGHDDFEFQNDELGPLQSFLKKLAEKSEYAKIDMDEYVEKIQAKLQEYRR